MAQHPIQFLVSELVDVVTGQPAARGPWALTSVDTDPRGESAIVSILVDNYENPIRLDIHVRGYWVASRARPSERGALPFRFGSDEPIMTHGGE